MEKEHDWLLIGATPYRDLTQFHFRCKWCLQEDDAYDISGPPKKRHMLDECKRD